MQLQHSSVHNTYHTDYVCMTGPAKMDQVGTKKDLP